MSRPRDWTRTRRWLDRAFCAGAVIQVSVFAAGWVKFGPDGTLGSPFWQVADAAWAICWASGIAWLVLAVIVRRRARRD